MNQDIKSIVIVGGGPAACLAALFLQTYVGNTVHIKVVSPTSIPPMTVGESTNGPFTGFLESLGLDRQIIINECDATLKIASEFDGWATHTDAYRWVHEFQPTERHLGIPLYHYWLKLRRKGIITGRYQDACFINSALVKNHLAPVFKGQTTPMMPYGYHLDGIKLRNSARDRALRKGTSFIEGKVVATKKDSNDIILELTLDDGRQITGDFFIDATGFHRQLVNLAYPDEPSFRFEPISDYHYCDRAVYTSIAREGGALRPSTLSTALSSGWVWDIPLRSKTSYGYVYSSRHLNDKDAEKEFLASLGNSAHDASIYQMSWTPGSLARAWHKNCLCIGVSNAFIEPIESLTSATLAFELNTLLRHFPDKRFDAATISSYCKKLKQQFADNRDFISLHYHTADRIDTPFWRGIKRNTLVSERVSELLSSFPEQAPYSIDGIYEAKGILGMFAARGIEPRFDLPLLQNLDIKPVIDILKKIEADRSSVVQQFMSHEAYLACLA